VLATIRIGRNVAVYPLPASVGKAMTALVWHAGEPSPALKALHDEVRELAHASSPAGARAKDARSAPREARGS
jgi:hypothetical protein